MKHALIYGASSITGYPLAKTLLLRSDWKVTGVQRVKHEHSTDCPKNYNIINADIGDFDTLRQTLIEGKVLNKVTHVFYTAWAPAESIDEETRVNKKMFDNVLRLCNESPKLKHVYLQTGTKYYGVHLGPKRGALTPSREDDPRLDEQIFYYQMEDALVNAAEKKGWRYSIARPSCIIGCTTGTAMNMGMSLAVYAMIFKELDKPLIYPFSKKSYFALREFADANVVVDLIAWMINPENYQAHDEVFNIGNGDYIRMAQLWPILADYFGMEVAFAEKTDKKFNLDEFMRDKAEVYNRVVSKHGLKKLDFGKLGTWNFMQTWLSRDWDELTLINKAYSFGFNNRVDTGRSLYDFFDGLQNRKIIPKFQRRVELPYLKKPVLVKKERVAPLGSPKQAALAH